MLFRREKEIVYQRTARSDNVTERVILVQGHYVFVGVGNARNVPIAIVVVVVVIVTD